MMLRGYYYLQMRRRKVEGCLKFEKTESGSEKQSE